MYEFIAYLFSLVWLSDEFQRTALAALLLMAPLSGILGVHVLTLRMGFFSDAVSHSTLVGTGCGLIVATALAAAPRGTPLDDNSTLIVRLVALLTAAAVAAIVLAIHRFSFLSRDTTIAVVMASVVSLGVLISHQSGQIAAINNVLFGDVLFLNPWQDLPMLAGLLAVAVAFSAWSYNRGLLTGLHQHLAEAAGVRTWRFELAFAMLMAASVALIVHVIGMLVVAAMLVVPAATARNLARSAGGMAQWAVIISCLCSVLGLALSSYGQGWPTGATIVLLNCLCFALSLPLARR